MTSENQQFLTMAIAYLEIGKIAAQAKSGLKNDGDYQNAVAYQLFHAVELFYKLMIKEKAQSVPHIHDLGVLEKEYTKHYPSPDCVLDHPFKVSNSSSCELNLDEDARLAEHMSTFDPKYMDQHLRYPIDNRTGGYSFSLDSSQFESIKDAMMKIYGLK